MKPNHPNMKSTKLITSLLAASLLVGTFTSAVLAKDKEMASLEAKAKVSRADAEKTALAKVPGGKVKDGELEEEKGKLIWSFDIAVEGSPNITEVAVDALTGEVVDVAVETPADQAKEKEEDAKAEQEKKGKHGKDKDGDEKEEKGEHKDKADKKD